VHFPHYFFGFQARHLKIYQKVDATLRSLACKYHICNSSRCSDIHNLVLSRTPVFSYFTTCAAPGRRVRKRAMPRSIKRRQSCPMWPVWREPKILEFVILLALYLRPEQAEWQLLAARSSLSRCCLCFSRQNMAALYPDARLEGATIFALFCWFLSACDSTKVS
jgi:hypothetical protein